MTYRLPMDLGVLAGIAMVSITASVFLFATNITTALIGYASVGVLVGLHRMIGGRSGAILSTYGLINIPVLIIWSGFLSGLRTSSAGALVIVALLIIAPLLIVLFTVSRNKNEFVPRERGVLPNDESELLRPDGVPVPGGDYAQRAAAHIEQAMPTIKASVDRETLILNRAGVPWGVAWAISQASSRTIEELLKWRDDAKVGTAILICPAFDADVKAAAKANGVKLITLA